MKIESFDKQSGTIALSVLVLLGASLTVHDPRKGN
ncbi:hypothetical protein G8J22_02110 [Lentilactobacillus hilgardii]|nr:hypothetical protein G8J22_02110 [Lentilactobacillus hilgardii]